MRIVLYFIIFALAIVLGLILKTHPGYILISYQHWTAEMPLWFGVIATSIVFLLFHYGLRLLGTVESTSDRLKEWYRRRSHDRANKLLNRGMLKLIEGNWKEAEKALVEAVDGSVAPVVLFLAAARAAQELGAEDRRDKYIFQAYEYAPSENLAVGITQAQLQIEAHQLESGLATLHHLRQLSPKHPYVLKLLYRLYVELHDWENLLAILPQLQKQKILQGEELETLEVEIYSHLLSKVADDSEAIDEVWHKMHRKLQYNPELRYVYCTALMDCGQYVEASKSITDYIKKEWDDELVALYGFVTLHESEKQLSIAEGWLKGHDRNVPLLVTLGRLAIRCQRWAIARDYLLVAQSIEDNPSIHVLLGYTYESLGEGAKALGAYRAGDQ